MCIYGDTRYNKNTQKKNDKKSKAEHLVLIGDHKQLKPAVATYEMAKFHNLDISLFERLMNNNINVKFFLFFVLFCVLRFFFLLFFLIESELLDGV